MHVTCFANQGLRPRHRHRPLPAVAVPCLALVADEEIFEQLLGFVGVAVLHQLLQPHGEQHLWRGKWGRGKWEVSEEAEVGVVMAAGEQHLQASEGADPLGVGARQAGQELLQERTVDVLEARAFGERTALVLEEKVAELRVELSAGAAELTHCSKER